ncbi:MAG: phosphodiester glycosidase family protein [Solirubrobacteraceae bacterium]
MSDALVGGFYVRWAAVPPEPPLTGLPLGELRLDGKKQPFVPFTHPWGKRRACISVEVRDGRAVSGDEEGFSAGAEQFDSDITVGRHPRAALGCDGEHLIALACDGRANDEAGLTLDELAATMVALGAREAINLDGGGSTSLVCGGRLRNHPREAHEISVPGGRAIATALVFTPR